MRIEGSEFGNITIDGKTYEHDVIIRLSGKVKKRQKKLSKRQYGTSHIISRAEQALLRAYALIQKGLDSQAQLWAYVDDFRYLALLCALCIPIAFFFKKPDPGAKGAG